MNRKTSPGYEAVALSVLAGEFSASQRQESDRKIAARLKRHELGAFDSDRVSRLRRLKSDVQKEVAKQARSRYYIGPADKRIRLRTYARTGDWDVPRLTRDLIARHSRISKRTIARFVPRAVFLYHVL